MSKIMGFIKNRLNRHLNIIRALLLYILVPGVLFWSQLKYGSVIDFSDQSLVSFCGISATASGIFLAVSIAFVIFLWQSGSRARRGSIVELKNRVRKMRESIIGNEDVLGDKIKTLRKLCSNIEAVTDTGVINTKRIDKHFNLLGKFIEEFSGKEFEKNHVQVLVRENLIALIPLFKNWLAREFHARVLIPSLLSSVIGMVVVLLSSLLIIVYANLSPPSVYLPDYMNFTCVIIIIYIMGVSIIQLIYVIGIQAAKWEWFD